MVRALGIPPGRIEYIRGVVDPLRARLMMETTKVFDGCGAKSSPTLGIFGLLFWPCQWLLDQLKADMSGVTIPGVGKISQGRPGIFSLTDSLVGIRHSIDDGRE